MLRVTVALAVVALAAPSGAAAAQVVGSLPAENKSSSVGADAYGVRLQSGGVITQWRTVGDSNAGDANATAALTVWDEAEPHEGAQRKATLVEKSAYMDVKPGVNRFKGSISVTAGQILGLSTSYVSASIVGDGLNRACFTNDRLSEVSQTATFVCGGPDDPGPSIMNLDATLERDADHDGLGDETQDGCPGAAGPMNGCPSLKGPITLADTVSAFAASVRAAVKRHYPGAREIKTTTWRPYRSGWKCKVTWSRHGHRYTASARADGKVRLTGVHRLR